MAGECENCGAPSRPGVLKCGYCGRPVSAEAARNAIVCPNPNCREPNLWGSKQCVRCGAWVVVQCVFCGGLSPHTMSECMNCKEPFAGAQERKAEQQAQSSRAQNLQTAKVVGGVAAGFLGALAGGVIGEMLDDD
jgi:hypothetical protein